MKGRAKVRRVKSFSKKKSNLLFPLAFLQENLGSTEYSERYFTVALCYSHLLFLVVRQSTMYRHSALSPYLQLLCAYFPGLLDTGVSFAVILADGRLAEPAVI